MSTRPFVSSNVMLPADDGEVKMLTEAIYSYHREHNTGAGARKNCCFKRVVATYTSRTNLLVPLERLLETVARDHS
jgi:hypothetical protein